eukprot:CAMPEP_0197445272 /NCGR_PEP_ID=MMETSP1175-20131217/10532_1 /TAXON_ID=1003142 /ORGANISM="Triceratium dubium, Strain CCMP147" /LENGTH=984 /DNA_ID=CAMNT_0042976205 /DNA_START=119 /DNA_END=3073 /DNA_ORIENTATION=+
MSFTQSFTRRRSERRNQAPSEGARGGSLAPSGEFADDGFNSEAGGGDPFYADNPISYRDEYVRHRSVVAGGGAGAVGFGGDQASHFGTSTIGTDEYDAVEEIARLYVICENALPRGEEPGSLTAVGREQLDQAWESIREWLTAHPSVQERQLAATYQGHHNTAAIHLVCKLVDPPLDIVEALVACSPETVRWQDSNGWLPLHHACANNASGEVLKHLIEAFPEGKVAQDLRHRTPLHFAFFRADATPEEGVEEDNGDEANSGDAREDSPPSGTVGNSMADVVKLLSDSGAANLPDENGMLPMHYACAYGTSTAVLRVLERAYPKSIAEREKNGRTPLHLTMVNAHRRASPSVLGFLIQNGAKLGIVNVPDNEGKLPLSILAQACKQRPFSDNERANATKCLNLYLDAGPKASADFLNAMQLLPEWLRDDAVINSHVQSVLNAKIVQRWPTAILLLDGYSLLILIVCFTFTSRDYIKSYPNNPAAQDRDTYLRINACVWLQIICGSYFLLRELMQVIAMLILNSFSSWLYDKDNWLDLCVIGLTLANSALMRTDPPYKDISNTDEHPNLRIMLALTQIVLWIALLFYIKSTAIGFAVFMGGVGYVIRRLVYFASCVLIFLFAFAMMFQIIYMGSEVCLEPGKFQNGECYENFPHCDFESSLLKVYTMMMGEIGSECRYLYVEDILTNETNNSTDPFVPLYPNMFHASGLGAAAYFIYAFIIVIILSNVLIAIVVQSYSVIKNERSAMVFWSNRLDFVAEMDAIGNLARMVKKVFMCGGGDKDGPGGLAGAPTSVQEVPGGAGIVTTGADGGALGSEAEKRKPMHDLWDNVMSLFDPDLFKEMEVHPGMAEFWFYVMLMILAAAFIPTWIIAGVLSAGVLWPPQVRKLLFNAKQSSSTTRKDVADQLDQEIDQLRKGMTRMKREFKRDIVSERAELLGRKAEINGVRGELLGDLSQIKEIMTSLRETAKEKIREREERAIAAAQNS